MLNLFFYVICIFLMIIGIVDVIKFIIFSFFYPKENTCQKTSDCDNLEYNLRKSAANRSWKTSSEYKIYLVPIYSTDEETEKIIEISTSEYGFIDVCNLNKIEKK